MTRWALDTAEGLELERDHRASERGARRWAQQYANAIGLTLYLWPQDAPQARGIDIEPQEKKP